MFSITELEDVLEQVTSDNTYNQIRSDNEKVSLLNEVDKKKLRNYYGVMETLLEEGEKTFVIICDVYPSEKRAIFYESYQQTAPSIKELKPLTDFLIKNNYETNLD